MSYLFIEEYFENFTPKKLLQSTIIVISILAGAKLLFSEFPLIKFTALTLLLTIFSSKFTFIRPLILRIFISFILVTLAYIIWTRILLTRAKRVWNATYPLNGFYKFKVIGDKSLSKRDFSRITKPLRLFGANIKSKNNSLPVEIQGTRFIRPINFVENIGSAQIKTACCFAALNSPGITYIKAKKSRNHTELLFKYLKIPIKVKSIKEFDLIEVKGLQQYNAFNYSIPGDISSSAFFIVLTLLSKNSEITIQNVNINETRIGIIKILVKMNSKITLKNKRVYKGERIADIFVESTNKLKSINCNSNLNSSAIDELILCFLVAAKAKGISTFKDLAELNKKESPRLDITIKFLRMIGIKVLRNKNDIKIYGKPDLDLKKSFHVKNFLKDHRIFMMSCIAALTLGGNWIINDKDSINTSFPKFLNILKKLGANIK